MKNGKNGKPHVLTLQDMEQDSLHFDLAASSVEELFEWYQVAWDITQREMSKQYNREQEVSMSLYNMMYVMEEEPTSITWKLERTLNYVMTQELFVLVSLVSKFLLDVNKLTLWFYIMANPCNIK